MTDVLGPYEKSDDLMHHVGQFVLPVTNLLLKYYITVIKTGGTAQKTLRIWKRKSWVFNVPDSPKVILQQVYTLQVRYWFYRPTITIVGPIHI